VGDGETHFTAPHIFQSVPGSVHTIVTQSPQTSGTNVQLGEVERPWGDLAHGVVLKFDIMSGSPCTPDAGNRGQRGARFERGG
jgi:hypothetical protein